MSAFLITPDDINKIQDAKHQAMANIISLEDLKRLAESAIQDKDGKISGKRPEDLPHPQEVVFAFGWRMDVSCEEQPNGLCLHLSVSSPTPKKTVPRQEVINMLLNVLQCKDDPVAVWVEEYLEKDQPAGLALNLLVPVVASL